MKRILKYIYNRIKYKSKVKFSISSILTNTYFEGKNAVHDNTKITSCFVGYGSYISNNTHLNNTQIGRFCSIADNISTCLGNHPTSKFVTTHPAFYYNTTTQLGYTFHKETNPLFSNINLYPKGENIYQVKIGNDVWIGSHVLILGGVTIGDGAVIAAGAIVTKDVEPYTIVAGVPAKPIRKRFSDDQINFLLKYQWWNKIEFIEKNYKEFQDIVPFYEKYNYESD